MNMKSVFESALNGTFDLTDMLGKINVHHIAGNLTDADREELIREAREKADPFGGVDVMAKLNELEERVRALEEAKVTGGESNEETVPEYQVGKWYYNGDKVTFDGKVYTCIAPAGAVCTWSPAEYPAYWD
jgi:hypothetical protein